MSENKSISEFINEVDNIYGLYFDCITGFYHWEKKFTDIQNQLIKTNPGLTIEERDKLSFYYGDEDPSLPGAQALHSTTQGDLKERIKKEGKNYRDIASACLVFIYQYWEDFYREKIARENGVNKNQIIWDIMGDISALRHSIIHNHGILSKKVLKCKKINGFQPGERICLTREQMKEIVKIIKSTIFSINHED